MENVVPIASLPDFIEATILKVRTGLAQARIAGTLVEMPEVIQFSVLVVDTWQPESLIYNSSDNGTNSGTQGGTTTTVTDRESFDTGIEIGTDSDSGTTVQESSDTTEATDNSTTTDTDSGTTTDQGYSESLTGYNGSGVSETTP